MLLKDQLGPDKPLQMSAASKGARMAWYKLAMAGGAVGVAAWWYYTGKKQERLQDAAVDKWGKHGEKAEYGKSFQEAVNKGDHFPGIPATETNTRGGHLGGAV